MHAQCRLLQRLTDIVWIWQHIQEIATATIEHIQSSIVGSIDHLYGTQARLHGNIKTPDLFEACSVLSRKRRTTWQGIRRGANLSAALHTTMSANRHNTTMFFSQPALREGDIDNGLDVLYAKGVLRNAHAPDQDARMCGVNSLSEAKHFLA